MRQGKKFERKDETKEGMELSAKADVDANLLAAITDEDSGILKAGLLPKLEAATPAGSKALLEGMQQASWKGVISAGFSYIYIYLSLYRYLFIYMYTYICMYI